VSKRQHTIRPPQDWPSRFVQQLREAAARHPDVITRLAKGRDITGYATSRITLSMRRMKPGPGGLRVLSEEEVRIAIGPSPMSPPLVFVDHARFIGFPHVLTGTQLCIYLDPTREWNPERGATGFLDRLYKWFEDAVAGNFDARTALFHPVGGRPHNTDDGTPLVVCRQAIRPANNPSLVYLVTRNDRRLDLLAARDAAQPTETVIFVRTPGPLHLGPGSTPKELFGQLGHPLARQVEEAWLKKLRRATSAGHDHVNLAVGVPRPDSDELYLLVGQVSLADAMAHPTRPTNQMEIKWCTVSDERPDLATRRDTNRPVAAYQGKRVAILGCGGLGSWIAEFIARAKPASIELSDYATVTGGLLVRQNYTDENVGYPKAEALAQRLHQITPGLEVTINQTGSISEHTKALLQHHDGIVIDCTVSLAVPQLLDAVVPPNERQGMVAQVATDVATGSLGLVVVAAGGSGYSVRTLDEHARIQVEADASLEGYATFWSDRSNDELIVNPGCSYPTFHGSAADMAAVAAEQTNLIALHINTDVSATHLLSLPHAGMQPAHHAIPAPPVN
jgi:hypothetical protein